MSDRYRCEVLIIGSGPGGAVTAWTLSAQGKDVLLLEEGPHLSLDSCASFSIDEMLQKYRSGGLNPCLGTPKIPFVEGCCVGGGSEINSGLYHRIPPEILELWRERFQVRHLEPENLLPHFEACESALSVQLNPGPPPAPSVKMKLGAERLGWKTMEVPRWFKYVPGSDPGDRFVGHRQSMTETLIPSAQRAGCRLMSGARAERLVYENGCWEARVAYQGKSIAIEAGAIFVCGGAVQTPALLLRSGIRTNIGRSLALHPTVKVVASFEDTVTDHRAEVAAQQVKEFSPLIGMGCSISSLPYIALAMTDHPDAKVDVARCWRHMAIYYAMITGPNHGSVRNIPFSTAPLIRYPLAAMDLRNLATAMRQLCRLLLAAGATHLYPSIRGSSVIRKEEDLTRIPAELPRQWTNLMTIHLFSSCPMGEDQRVCSTDSFGRVHGHRNLFINDASLLPTAPGVNPQGAVMAVARRNALHFLEESSK